MLYLSKCKILECILMPLYTIFEAQESVPQSIKVRCDPEVMSWFLRWKIILNVIFTTGYISGWIEGEEWLLCGSYFYLYVWFGKLQQYFVWRRLSIASRWWIVIIFSLYKYVSNCEANFTWLWGSWCQLNIRILTALNHIYAFIWTKLVSNRAHPRQNKMEKSQKLNCL